MECSSVPGLESTPLRKFVEPLLSLFAQLVHIFDGGLVDEGLVAAADLEGVAVVPLDAAFDLFAVFEHDHHGCLRLDLLLQVEEFCLAIGAFVDGGLSGKPKGERRERGSARAGKRTAVFRLAGLVAGLIADWRNDRVHAHTEQPSTRKSEIETAKDLFVWEHCRIDCFAPLAVCCRTRHRLKDKTSQLGKVRMRVPDGGMNPSGTFFRAVGDCL